MKSQLAITVDLEWWGRANLLSGAIEHHLDIEKDIQATEQLLELFKSKGVKATFFTVSQDFSGEFLRKISKDGHEIAAHSKTHPLLYTLPHNQLLKELSESKKELEDMTGVSVEGFRAPSWSVTFEMKDRFFDALKQTGYRYDSSLCGFKTHLYGDARFPSTPFIENGVAEFPLPKIGPLKFPHVGGFYFRLTPEVFLKSLICNGRPSFLYFHPWEFYPSRSAQGSILNRVIDSYGRETNFQKLSRVIDSISHAFEFKTLGFIAGNFIRGDSINERSAG